MRRVTRQVAFEPGGWTAERRAKVAELFDSLAVEWHTRLVPGRDDALADALDRGLADRTTDGWCLDVGAGIGGDTARLEARFANVVAVDLAWQMLARGRGARLQADAAELPVRRGAVATVVLVNALLFPAEVDRVLAAHGSLVWVNSSGDGTPIYLPVSDVALALPGDWEGVASEAGWGTWGVLWRVR